VHVLEKRESTSPGDVDLDVEEGAAPAV
jgi:hypothetical protein